MATWLEDIQIALERLGGLSHYASLYEEMEKIRGTPMDRSKRATIQRTIQDHSPISAGYKNKKDIFYSVDGLGSGVWGLTKLLTATPVANDMETQENKIPIRVKQDVYRILRDTELVRKLKKLYKDQCQLCKITINIGNKTYSEGHHIQPLGGEHKGPDASENILILCPNCHARCDYF